MHVARGLCVQERRVGPVWGSELVVVVRKDEDLRMVLEQRRAQVRADEVGTLLRRVDAGLPHLGLLRLILRGERPDGEAVRLVRGDPLGDVLGPCRPALRPQTRPARVVHAAVRLHPGGRAPGRGQEAEAPAVLAEAALGSLDEGYQCLCVMLHAAVKVLQTEIAVEVVEGVRRRREVAAVDGHAAEGVAEPLGTKVPVQDLLLQVRPEALEDNSAGLCEGPTEADDLLVRAGQVDVDGGTIKLKVCLEGHIGLLREEISRISCRLYELGRGTCEGLAAFKGDPVLLGPEDRSCGNGCSEEEAETACQ
mmetsp:Transcript_63080/g.195284  ORF Transcript_63080/g.195284 Transcript_63080/m.195284 type:complete len:308 (+) Transcript_63080:740-1663(+)